MEMQLAENIRRFRRERALTQEQLSEALGVTAGAVYKWEAKMSVPELNLIVEMADLFDTSVDVLLGYEMKDNRLETTVKRLQEYRRRKDRTGLTEAEKAIKKHPNSFPVVRECAALYNCFGLESGDRELLRRALVLMEQSLLLQSQNTDPRVSEQTLCGQMATAFLGLDEPEKAVELMKAHNAGGMHNHMIGQVLALGGHTGEALPFLSEALAQIVTELIHTITGYINVYFPRGDYDSAQAVLRCGIDFFLGLRKENTPNFLDKIGSGFLAVLAQAQFLSGQPDKARSSLERAREMAAFFDAAPSYDESDIRFIGRIEGASAYDTIGATAAEVIRNIVADSGNDAFIALWTSVAGEEETAHE